MSTLRSRAFYRRLREFQGHAGLLSLSVPAKRIDETAVVEDEDDPSAHLDFLDEMVRKMTRRERQAHSLASLELFDLYAGPDVPKYVLKRTFKRLLLSMEERFFSDYRMVFNPFGFAYSFEYEHFRSLYLTGIVYENAKVGGKLLKDEIHSIFLKFGTLRKQIVLEILVALFNETRSEDQTYLRLLWKAVPYPFISSAEMFALLEPFFMETRLSLQELCDEYKKCNFIFEVPEVPETRSLKHLSRVQVRKSLSNSTRNNAVDSLDIPSELKGYLKLDSF